MSKAGTYSFQAEPRPVVDARSKFREPQEQKVASNIMHDRRVVRGNTYSSIIPTAAQTRALQSALEQKEMQQKRATQMRTMAIARQREITRQRALEPEPVPGRAHMPVQTDDVLEELVDKVLETDHGTQTDPIDDRPEPPKFKTRDPGVDKSTEILAGELFSFDLAVEPILEVIVGKCLDQGLMEVLEEEEMKRIQSHKRSFEEKRDALIADAQKLEAATQRRYDEKERRLKQERERVAREQDLAKKLAAQSVAQQFLAGLPNTIDRKLEKDGFYMDPILTQIQSDFMPWLMKNVATHLEQTKEAQRQVDDIITAAINGVRAQRDAKIQADKEEAERIRKEQEAERARQEAERIRLAEEKAKREREEEERRKKAEEDGAEGDQEEEEDAAD